jgi:hypothetical protein
MADRLPRSQLLWLMLSKSFTGSGVALIDVSDAICDAERLPVSRLLTWASFTTAAANMRAGGIGSGREAVRGSPSALPGQVMMTTAGLSAGLDELDGDLVTAVVERRRLAAVFA